MNTVRNIIAVDCAEAGGIIGLRRVSRSSVAMSGLTPWKGIPIRVPAKLTVSDKIENGVRLYAAQLAFHTCEEPGERERKVYRCKMADGRYCLIGCNERPYPVTTVNDNHPDNMTDSQLYEVTVSYTSAAMIPSIE